MAFIASKNSSIKEQTILSKKKCWKLLNYLPNPTKGTGWHGSTTKTQISLGTSAQSNQSLSFPDEETLNPWLPRERPSKSDQIAQMLNLIWVFDGRTCHFVSFA